MENAIIQCHEKQTSGDQTRVMWESQLRDRQIFQEQDSLGNQKKEDNNNWNELKYCGKVLDIQNDIECPRKKYISIYRTILNTAKIHYIYQGQHQIISRKANTHNDLEHARKKRIPRATMDTTWA